MFQIGVQSSSIGFSFQKSLEMVMIFATFFFNDSYDWTVKTRILAQTSTKIKIINKFSKIREVNRS